MQVAGPAAVRRVSHTPSRPNRIVGSPRPWRSGRQGEAQVEGLRARRSGPRGRRWRAPGHRGAPARCPVPVRRLAGHWNRSNSPGISTSAIRPSPRVGLAPRTIAAGRPAVLPSASSAAVAISSAVARTVLLHDRGRPRRACRACRRAGPCRSRRSPRPRCPSATAGRSCRRSSTGTSTSSSARIAGPDAVGGGVRIDRQERHDVAAFGPTLDASTPPLAQTKPCVVSVIRTPLAMRTTRRASRRTTSSWRGSRSQRSGEVHRLGPRA